MPDWKAHSISSLLVFALAVPVLSLSLDSALLALGLLLFSGLLPDLDHPRSFIRQVLGLFFSFLVSAAVFTGIDSALEVRLASSIVMFLLVFLAFRKIPLRHRGKRSMHRWGFGLALFLLCAGLFWLIGLDVWLSLFALAGYWLHLALDRAKSTKI